MISKLLRKLGLKADHNKTYKQLVAEGYSSQYGQDKYIAELLNQKQNGVFIDIGAHNGVNISNSYYFEKKLSWTGIAIEPMPEQYAALIKNRNCICVNGCVYKANTQVAFTVVGGGSNMLSGIAEKLNDQHKKRIYKETKGEGQHTITVQAYTLSSLLTQYQIGTVDFMSIDTEGSEYEILQSIDFSTTTIKYITVENNYNDTRIENLLTQHNYKIIKRLGCDDIYELG